MLKVEQALTDRLPWLEKHPRILRPIAAMLERLAHEERFNDTLRTVAPATGFAFVERTLDHLRVSYRVDERERENIPVEGPLLVVANHPLGMTDALALISLIGSVRQDVRILGNDHFPRCRNWATCCCRWTCSARVPVRACAMCSARSRKARP